MVHCPNCGTPNKDGSKFCNDCGTPLAAAAATRRCPVCQTANPAGNVRCDNCGTRLTPVSPAPREDQPPAGPAPVKGLQLPTKEPAGASPSGEAEPDWLRQLRGGTEPPAPAAGLAPAADVPDWLKALGSAEPAAPASGPAPAAEDVPDWLSSLGGPATPAANDAAPDWLQVVEDGSGPAPAAPEPTVPDWLKDASAASAPEPEVPDWLRGAAPAQAPSAPPPARAQPAPAAPPADTGLPDWLSGSGGAMPWETPPAEQPAAPAASGAFSDDLPDWLRSVEPAPAARPAPQPAAPAGHEETRGGDQPAVPADLPDWLRGLQASAAAEPESQPEPQPAEPASPDAADVPDWLANFTGGGEPAPGADQSLAAAELPDWLRSMAPEMPPAPAQPPQSPAAPVPPKPSALPAGARDQKTEPAPRPPEPPATPKMPAAPAELPDWLQGMAADFDKPLAPGEMPDWLGSTPPAAAPPSTPQVTPGQPPQASVPLAAQLAAPGAPSEIEDGADLRSGAAQLAPADIPDWLRAMRPDSGEGAAPSGGEWGAVPAAGPGTGGLAEAAIPDWLQALKPRELREPGAAAVEVAEAAETAGVLAGIRGVIAAEPIIAIPRQAPPAVPATATPKQVELADWLQRLATEEVVAPPRTMSRAAEVRSAAMRGFVYLLVLVAALLPLLGSAIPGVSELVAPFFPDPLPAGSLSDTAVQAAYNSVEAAQAGDAVLLGFDVNSGAYGEMQPLAQALISHFTRKGSRVVVVSTQASGPALADSLFLYNRYSDKSYINMGYLSGGPLGLALLAGGTTGLFGADFHGDMQWASHPALHNLTAGDAQHVALDLSRFKLVAVITNDPQVLRGWVEQVHVRHPRMPMIAAVSAASESLALSYWRPDAAGGQLTGVISGVAGADRYERALGADSHGDATGTRPARGLAQLAVAALIVIGVCLHGIGMLLRRGHE